MRFKVYSATIAIIALFAVNIILAFRNSQDPPLSRLMPYEDNSRSRAYILPISGPNYMPILNSSIARPVISGKSAIVYDTASSRFLYQKDINTRVPIASLTKILSAVVILENLDINDIVTIASGSVRVDGKKQDLYPGEKLSVRNLLKLMLIESSNDAAYALASYTAKTKGVNFIDSMNAKAVSLGMRDSMFIDPAGLDDRAYSTAEDLVKLVSYSLKYQEIWNISAEKTAIIESSDETIKHSITSTNRLLGLIRDIIGGKTGYTDGALQCMILVANVPDYKGQLVSIVLGSQDRFGDTQKLIEWTRTAYRWR